MRVEVQKELCMGGGACELEAPGVFRLDEQGTVELLTAEPDPHLHKATRLAAAGCPAGIIEIHE